MSRLKGSGSFLESSIFPTRNMWSPKCCGGRSKGSWFTGPELQSSWKHRSHLCAGHWPQPDRKGGWEPRKRSVDADSLCLARDLGVYTCFIFCCFYPLISRGETWSARMSHLTNATQAGTDVASMWVQIWLKIRALVSLPSCWGKRRGRLSAQSRTAVREKRSPLWRQRGRTR